jgi:hypothetical protein
LGFMCGSLFLAPEGSGLRELFSPDGSALTEALSHGTTTADAVLAKPSQQLSVRGLRQDGLVELVEAPRVLAQQGDTCFLSHTW